MTTRTTAAVVEQGGGPFVLRDVELAAPRADEVLVRIVAAGICHTDLSVQSGALPFPLPGILGHEGAGVVERVGDGVTKVRPGDQVLLSFTSCGRCGNCRGGHPAYCDTWLPRNLIGGARADGSPTVTMDGTAIGGHFFGQSSFAGYALADERSVVRVDDDAPLDFLAPLGCGIQTGFGTVWNVLRPGPGSTVAVFGVGAVGLAAIMAAHLTPVSTIIAVDRIDSRLELAGELGATHAVNADREDVAAALQKITGGRGVDHAVEATGNTGVLRLAVETLGVEGTCAIVGAPPMTAEVSLNVTGLLTGKRIIGVTIGDAEPETMIPQMVELAKRGRLPMEKLVRHYSVDEINAAVEDMHSGKTIKPVIRFAEKIY
jgi:aryl-alcohol dehydrogenase